MESKANPECLGAIMAVDDYNLGLKHIGQAVVGVWIAHTHHMLTIARIDVVFTCTSIVNTINNKSTICEMINDRPRTNELIVLGTLGVGLSGVYRRSHVKPQYGIYGS
jgi:hypothetical protein